MRRLTGRLLTPLAAASAIVVAGAIPAAAQPPPNPEVNAFEVEVHTLGRSGAVGKPEVVHATCAHHYLDAKGNVHARLIDFTGGTISPPPA